jgi:PhoH-like ATPase
MAKKIYVLDTNVYLTDSNSILSYGNNDIIIPLKVLEEIDKHKKRQDGVGLNARNFIRFLDDLRTKGSLKDGVRIAKGKGLARTRGVEGSASKLPCDFDIKDPDNQIIAIAKDETSKNLKRKVILVSRDINMRVKCDALGIECQDHISNQVVKDVENVYSGIKTHLVDEQLIDRFYERTDVFLEQEEIKPYPNQFLMLVSNSNEKKTALAKFVSFTKPLKRIEVPGKGIWGVKPRNKEQSFAMYLLTDKSVPIVTLVGKAGCGKTLLAVAAGLEQVIEEHKESTYDRLIVSRPIQTVGKDIGYLPGTIEEKMTPWMAPIEDNLKNLIGSNKSTLHMYMEQGIIEIEALTYIRGRSISNAYIVIDEAQNLTRHELKTIITRVGENTKIVLTGDIEQIDNIYVDETSNGLTYAVEKFKEHELAGHITFRKGERSKVATLASKIL